MISGSSLTRDGVVGKMQTKDAASWIASKSNGIHTEGVVAIHDGQHYVSLLAACYEERHHAADVNGRFVSQP